jgi:hypothetical protein
MQKRALTTSLASPPTQTDCVRAWQVSNDYKCMRATLGVGPLRLRTEASSMMTWLRSRASSERTRCVVVIEGMAWRGRGE